VRKAPGREAVAGLSGSGRGDSVGEVMEHPTESDSLRWEQHGERTVYESPWVQVTRVDVTSPDGNRFEHHAVRLKKVASVVILDDEDRVLLVWRHRFITNSWGWETPGGIVDDGETAEQAAVRETVEETGWRPEGLRLLAAFQPMPGLVDTPHEVYVSRRAVKVGEPSDMVEAGLVRWVALADVRSLIKRGEITGSGSLVGLLYAACGAG
jgi:8-oxo-dGDP phosphatase